MLLASDTVNGQEGKAYATINGRVEEMFFVKDLEAKVEKQKTEIKTLGRRSTQHKANGWTGTGSATLYYVSTLFRNMMLQYMKTGKDTYFDMQIINEDPTGTIGKQTIVLKRVNIDSVIMAKLDVESETLEEDIDFTFEDVEMLDAFGTPIAFFE